MTAVAFAVAGRRVFWLSKLIRTGQPATPTRTDDVPQRIGIQVEEVFGQRRLLKWSGPGLAHFFTFWGFVILGLTIIEAYGSLFWDRFAIPLIGRWTWVGFLEDFFALAVLLGLAYFAITRLRLAPDRQHRASRFYGSHTGPAWVILGMITLVIVTLVIYRGAQINTRHFPYGHNPDWGGNWWTFFSMSVAKVLHPLGHTANSAHRDDLHPGPDRRDRRLPGDRRLQQAPAHLPGAAQRHFQAAAEGARQPARHPRHRVPHGRRGPAARCRQDRGLQLEGHARHGHLHRVRPLPEPVPGVEHRQAAVSQARDHGPARPPVREGALPAGWWWRGRNRRRGNRRVR